MSIKQERMNGRIRQILSELLFRDVSDPRLYGITITKVELDAELLFAKVWVNALGEEERMPEILGALKHANGFLRREVAKRVRLRKAPELSFRWDASVDSAERVFGILNTLDLAPKPAEPVPADEIEYDDDEYEEADDFDGEDVETDDDSASSVE